VWTGAGETCLVKVPLSDNRGRDESLLVREFGLFKALGGEHCIVPLQMDRIGETRVACYQDFDAEPVGDSLLRQPLSAGEFVTLAGAMCGAVAAFHRRGIVIVGLSPWSFLRSHAGHELRISDAPLAQRVGMRAETSPAFRLDSPFLPYAAPEVLGGMPNALGAAVDLYALGAIFYELLCRRPPFDARDPAALIQCHLAKQAPSLDHVAQGISAELASIVMRLLAKQPSERFDSVAFVQRMLGAQVDSLARVWEAGGSDQDAVKVPPLSTALYGRESAIEQLVARLGSKRATPTLLLVEGGVGIGKTTLAREVHSVGVFARVARGRFHARAPGVPLSGWASALSDLANSVLTQSAAEMALVRERVCATLGDTAGLIGAIVPEWDLILRTHPPEGNDAMEAGLNRLGAAVRGLLGCFASANAPLLLVLDDLQWADASSLQILELVLTLPDGPNIVVFATRRTGEETATAEQSDLEKLLAGLQSSAADVVRVELGNWGARELESFLRDSFDDRLEAPTKLAEFLRIRTDGNPLFVAEWLKALVEQRALGVDHDTGLWILQSAASHNLPLGDDLASLLAKRIRALPVETRHALTVGACLGVSFELGDLCTVASLEPEDAWRCLDVAVQGGLLAVAEPETRAGRASKEGVARERYEFVHDRVAEAAKTLLNDAEQAGMALRIARSLLRASGDGERPGERTLALAGHFNAAIGLIDDPAERLEVAELNLVGGRHAKRRGAFSQALSGFQVGLELLGVVDGNAEEAWTQHYALTRALYEEAAVCALLARRLELAEVLADTLLSRLREPLDRVHAYDVRISALKVAKRHAEAVRCALQVLGELGVSFPKKPTPLHAALGFILTKHAVFAGPLSRLSVLPEMKDPRTKAVSRIIQSVYSAAYLGRPDLFPLLVFRHVRDSLRYGNEEYSVSTYMAFAIVLAGMGSYGEALRLGSIALELLDRFGVERLRASAIMGFYPFLMPWKNHLKEIIPHLEDGLASGFRYGDFEYSCYLITMQSLARLHTGASLAELEPEFAHNSARVAAYRQTRSILLQDLLTQVVRDLRVRCASDGLLVGPIYDEASTLPLCLEPRDDNLAFNHYFAKLMLAVFLGRQVEAKDAARLGSLYVRQGAFGLYLQANFTFYAGIAGVMTSAGARPTRRELRVTRRAMHRLEAWARSAPANFSNKFHLLAAELARVQGRDAAATAHYEKACAVASEHGLIHELALAQERAAAFYLERGLPRLAQHYLADSHANYTKWGAGAVTRRLELEHAQQFALIASEGPGRQGTRFAEGLDYQTLLKSSQAIASEFFLPQLLERLLKTTLEHAGAQRGLLLLERQGLLYVEAEADVDVGVVHLESKELLDQSSRLCQAIVRYVARTEKPVLLVDAAREGLFANDPYCVAHRTKSVLCSPILFQGRLLGVAYLENNRVSHVFTDARLEIVRLLVGQAAISITISRFHALQIEAHQAKINPHFLFNALSSIADLAVCDGPRAEEALIHLAQLYRYILTTSAEELVTLTQELEIVRSYLELEKIRFGAKLEYTLEADPDMGDVRLPGLLIQPLVENSIRHGVGPKTTPGRVWISARRSGQRCSIVVQDDGQGGKPSSKGTGFGLKSVQERLLLAYRDAYSFSISRADGYRVELEIPLVRDG
jgi:predicted ATPase/GAF domain-containing protein